MADLTANKPRRFQGEPGPRISHAVAAGLHVYAGAALMEGANGEAALVAQGALTGFLGFAYEEVDNSSGLVAAKRVIVEMRGLVWLHVADTDNWSRTDLNNNVFASDSDTFTTDSATSTNRQIGKVALVPEEAIGSASAMVLVAFEAECLRSL